MQRTNVVSLIYLILYFYLGRDAKERNPASSVLSSNFFPFHFSFPIPISFNFILFIFNAHRIQITPLKNHAQF